MANDDTGSQPDSGSVAGGAKGSLPAPDHAGIPVPPHPAPPPLSEPPALTTVPMAQLQVGQISQAPGVTPERPDVQLITGFTYVGFTMAKIFSSILAVYLLFAAVSVWFSEGRMLSKMDAITQGLTITEMKKLGGQTNSITKDDIEALTKSVSEAYRETRAATIEFHKTVIINVLLPILTALLGYLFGNREKNGPNQKP